MAIPAQQHAEKLAWELESWKSIEFQIRGSFENNARRNESEFSAYRSEDHYIETAIGQRLFEERLFPVGEDAVVTINYADGERCANETVRAVNGIPRRQVIIKRAFSFEDQDGQTHRPEPLKAFYIGLEPLSKALPRATPLGTKRHLDRDCDLFLFPKTKDGPRRFDLVYWLDQETSIPLRIDYFADEQARAKGQLLDSYLARSLDDVEGRHLSLNYEVVSYLGEADPQAVQYLTKNVVESVRFDQEYPKSIFWPVITREVSVYDTIKKTNTPGVMPVTQAAGAPIRAEESLGMTSLVSLVLLTAGLIVLVVGIVTAVRRRKRPAV